MAVRLTDFIPISFVSPLCDSTTNSLRFLVLQNNVKRLIGAVVLFFGTKIKIEKLD